MTDNEIVRALECCTRGRKGDEIPCTDCSYEECNIVGGTSERQTSGTCQSWLMKDALDLINRQKAEIERLKLECGLAQFTQYKSEFVCFKAEVIKEFTDRLIGKANSTLDRFLLESLVKTVKNEMVGGNDAE